MKNYLRILLAGLSLSCNGLPAAANFLMTPSGGTTVFAIDAGNQGTSLCAAASTECPASVPVNTAGSPFFTSGNPGLVTISQGANSALVKAGNSAAATDVALVVSDPNLLSAINSSIPAGTNLIGGVNVAQINGTTTDSNSGTKSAGTIRVVLATDQPQLTNKLLVTPDANSAINVAQIGGNATLTGNGTTGTGSQRVTVASDNTPFATKVDQTTPGTTNGIALVGVNGATALAGNGTTGTGSPRVTIASDNTAFSVNAQYGGTALVADPCQANAATWTPITVTTATTTKIVTGTSAKKLYVCYLYLQNNAADNIEIISGTTGGTCGANTAALLGGTSSGTGLVNAANSGQAIGNGSSAVMQVTTNNDDICLVTHTPTTLAGVIKTVVQ